MGAEPRRLQTQAEKDLIELFAAWPDRADSQAVAEIRQDAFRRFEAAGLPHRRIEAYRYTDLRAILRAVPPIAGPAGPEAAREAIDEAGGLADIERHRIAFVNGLHEAAFDRLAGAKGLAFESLAATLPHGHALRDKLGLSPLAEKDPVVQLNTAFMRDGAVLHVRAGCKIEQPVEIAHRLAESTASVFVRHVVDVEAGAEVTFVETYRGPEGLAYQVNAVTELRIGDGAKVTWVKLQNESRDAVHLSTLVVSLGERAHLEHFVLQAGAAQARNQLFLAFAGEHATLATRGATLVEGRRHADTTLVVDHAVPHGASRELYKAVIDDEARSVFQGKIIVRQHAQKTDGKMSSNAILLSDRADAMNKPELEIFADDVVCGHGATTGEIDERLRFYLMSRGIPAAEAEKLLIIAFLGEALEGIEHEGLRDAAAADIEAWLDRRAARAEA